MAAHHPLLVPGLLAAGAAIVTYEVASHLLSADPRGGPAKLKAGDAKKISPGGTPGAVTAKPNKLNSPGATIKQDPSGKLSSAPRTFTPSGTPASGGGGGGNAPSAPSSTDPGGGGSDSDDHSDDHGASLPNAPSASLPSSSSSSSSSSDQGGGGSDPSDPGSDTGFLGEDSVSSSSDDDDAGGSSSDDDSGASGSDDAGGLPASVATGVASGATSTVLGDAADAIMGLVSGPLTGARTMNPEMQWIHYQWCTLQDASVDAKDIPPPPHVAANSGSWHRYDEGIAKGFPSHDPREVAYLGIAGNEPPPLPAPLPKGTKVVFKAYQGVPRGMVVFAWRPRTGSTDKINGYWVYGLGLWSVRPPSGVHPDGGAVFDTGMQIPDPPGSIFDSFWTKLFDGSYEIRKHEIPGSTEVLRSLGLPAGHDGGHWALIHPGYAVWLNWENTADDFSPPLRSYPIPVEARDPRRYPRVVVHVDAPPPRPYPRFQSDGSVDVNVDVDAPVYTGPPSFGPPPEEVFGPPPPFVPPPPFAPPNVYDLQGPPPSLEAMTGPDVYPAGFGPSAPIPPPWAAQANYTPGAAYAAQLPPGVPSFPPPSIPVASQQFLAATSLANNVPTQAGEFEQGFAEAISDEASAASMPPDFAQGDPDQGPNYGDPNVQQCTQDVCTLPDGSLGVWCDPCTGWTPYFPGVEFDLPPPDGCPVFQDDGSGPDDPPLPVCDLPDGTLGVWSTVENGWVNYFPGCETGAPPPPGAPVY